MRAFCPKPFPTVCATELNVCCCAATRFHRDGGDGRLLAAFDVLAAEEQHELPQKQRRAPDEHARFRNNMTTLMRNSDMNKMKKSMKKNHLAAITDRIKVATYDIKDTVDSEDLTPNITGVDEQQNKILHQIDMNPVKKCLEMLEETGEKKEDHKTFYEQIVEYMRFGIHEKNSVFDEMTSNTNLCQERNGTRPMQYFYDSTEFEGTVHTPLIIRIIKKRKLEQVT